ncbi:MAG: transglutaminase-like domain-containing protein [Thermoanaerobaculia bacterium]|nr:transglutaminase-like domain-containing protein [Thermoanaerobaculia bacterium]
MRELWSREDERDLTEFLDAVRREDLVGALFAIEGTPPVSRRLAEAVLDDAAAAVRERAAGTRSSFQKARLLARVLAEELGFAGDEDDYYDPRNVLLGPLLERRKGMPILLSVLWMEVGRRAKIPVAGIGLPGHFIVRVGPPPGTLADPFAGGVPLTVDDCRRKVKALAGGRVPWRADYLRQMEIPALLERVLRNLSGCRGRTGDEAGRFRAVTFLSALRPDEPENLLSRAELAEELGVRGLAREVWAEIVERFPESTQAQAASEKMAEEDEPPVFH